MQRSDIEDRLAAKVGLDIENQQLAAVKGRPHNRVLKAQAAGKTEVDLRNSAPRGDIEGRRSQAVASIGHFAAAASVAAIAVGGFGKAVETMIDAFDKAMPVPRQADADHPLVKRLGVMVDGKVRPNDVLAYDADAGWVECGRYTTINGVRSWRRERGRILTYKLAGLVEPFWR